MKGAVFMPIYEYHCLKCRKDHEIIRKFSDKPLKICPSCGGKMERKLSLSGFQLKGGGWYKDGYASVKTESKQSSQKVPAPQGAGAPSESPKKEKPDPKPAKASSPRSGA